MRTYFSLIFLCFACLLPQEIFAQTSPARGLYVSVIQEPPVLESAKEINSLIEFAKKAQIKTLVVQVYRGNQAWFPTDAADQSPYDRALANMGEDPFAFLIRKAHESGIEVHAWMNLLSIGNNHRAPLLKKYGVEILTRNISKKRSLPDYKIDSQYFLEPGDLRVREDLAVLLADLLKTYHDLDGVHFDYIRYPDKNPEYGYAPMNIERFKKETGQFVIDDENPVWKKWKRDQVTAVLEHLVKTVRSIRPRIQISTTGCMPYVRAYEEAFQDWASWLSKGLVDFVATMSYVPTVDEFEKYLFEAISKVPDFRKVFTAIGAYDLTSDPETFAEQLRLCQAANGKGCIIFHYGTMVTSKDLAGILVNGTNPINQNQGRRYDR